MEQTSRQYSQIGDYAVLKTIGVGGSCKVKLGQHIVTKEFVALKILRSDIEDKFIEWKPFFENEIKIMKDIDHKNIVKFIDGSVDAILFKKDGRQIPSIYMVLEYAPGRELFDFVAIAGQFSEPIARYYFKQIIEALDYLY